MFSIRRFAGLVAAACWLALNVWDNRPCSAEQPSEQVDFQRDVAPLLARRCLGCHSGPEPKGHLDLTSRESALTGGESGPAFLPGEAGKSLLVEYVAENKMPPQKPLGGDEKKLLQSWIDRGASWSGATRLDPMTYSGDERAGLDWWSLQTLDSPMLPNVNREDWCRAAIDRFVLAELERNGLTPSPPADRRSIARRLWFDLLGLPPSPEDVDAFLVDARPDAYERLVERLLASPAHGEHWSRHWLDIAHFGESDGFEFDKLRPHAWPYRDWVIQALNQDLPFDEFARRQIAGDLLVNSSDGVCATGFIVGGGHDSLKPAVESMRMIMRQDELEDLTALVGQTFLGLTVQCARCHDHKFDPIRQADYYRFAALLSGVHRGNRSVADRKLVASLEVELHALEKRLQELESPARAAALLARAGRPIDHRDSIAKYEWDFRKPLEDAPLSVALHGSATMQLDGLTLDGTTAYAATKPIELTLREKTFEAWVTLSKLQQRGGAVIGLQSLDGVVFDAIVYAEREANQWMSGSDNFARTQSISGQDEATSEKSIHIAVTYATDGTITIYRNGERYGKNYKSSVATFESGKAQILFGMRHGPPSPKKMLAGTIHRARLHDRSLSADEVRESFRADGNFVREVEIVGRLSPSQLTERVSLHAALSRVRDQLRGEQEKQVFAITPQQAPVVHVLSRGSPLSPNEPVSPGGLSALRHRAGAFDLAKDADDANRRTGLARWITSKDNPLFARTIVNRLWQYHLGQGLIRTPNDLGFNGGKPSHPELLDWLAIGLVDDDFSLKAVHRKIVMSATYRQSAGLNKLAMATDADNVLLWRRTPQRLSSEMLRDAMLCVAGALNSIGGGPGFQDFRPFLRGGTQFYERIDPDTAVAHRRTVYRTWARGGTNPLLDAFDCPDPSTLTPKRSSTNTPLQSLALLNNSFSMRMAERLARRLERESGGRTERAVEGGFLEVYCRHPEPEEVEISLAFVEQHGLDAWCRVLLNSNEFLYVR